MFEDMHKHRFIFMPSVRQPYQIHDWIKGWLWHHTLNLSTNNHSTTHITYPGWQNPNSSQIPIPAASSVGKGSSSPRGATQVQKLQDTKGRTVKGSHQSAALALATVCWNAAPLSPKVKTTQTHMHIPQKSFSIGTHLCLWQGGRSLRLALSMGKLRAFWSSQRYNCSYQRAWRRAIRSLQKHRSVPEFLFYQGLGECFSQNQVKNTGLLCFSSCLATAHLKRRCLERKKQNQAQSLQRISSETSRKPEKLNLMLHWAWVQMHTRIQSWKCERWPVQEKEGKKFIPSASGKLQGLPFLTFSTSPMCNQERSRAKRIRV